MSNDRVKYGLGGFDPEHPTDNVVERLVDNENGTGVLTTYSAEGEIVVETIVELPLPEPDALEAAKAKIGQATSMAKLRSATLEALEALE